MAKMGPAGRGGCGILRALARNTRGGWVLRCGRLRAGRCRIVSVLHFDWILRSRDSTYETPACFWQAVACAGRVDRSAAMFFGKSVVENGTSSVGRRRFRWHKELAEDRWVFKGASRTRRSAQGKRSGILFTLLFNVQSREPALSCRNSRRRHEFRRRLARPPTGSGPWGAQFCTPRPGFFVKRFQRLTDRVHDIWGAPEDRRPQALRGSAYGVRR